MLKKIRIILPSSLTIPRRQVTSPCDLSDAQMAIWSEEQAAPGNPALILTAAIRMRGEVDEEALSLSLNDIISRHEILRTSFPIIDGKPVQAIAE
ncbi:MAG TPA: condensation domain-containing protein, partial [Blastocatellia bacterium]